MAMCAKLHERAEAGREAGTKKGIGSVVVWISIEVLLVPLLCWGSSPQIRPKRIWTRRRHVLGGSQTSRESERLQPDIVTYSSGISACEKAARWTEALSVLEMALDQAVQDIRLVS